MKPLPKVNHYHLLLRRKIGQRCCKSSSVLYPSVILLKLTLLRWDYSDIFIEQEAKASKAKETLAILEESEEEVVDIQLSRFKRTDSQKLINCITLLNFRQQPSRFPNTIGSASAFIKPDNKDIQEAFKKIVKKELSDVLIEQEAVKGSTSATQVEESVTKQTE